MTERATFILGEQTAQMLTEVARARGTDKTATLRAAIKLMHMVQIEGAEVYLPGPDGEKTRVLFL